MIDEMQIFEEVKDAISNDLWQEKEIYFDECTFANNYKEVFVMIGSSKFKWVHGEYVSFRGKPAEWYLEFFTGSEFQSTLELMEAFGYNREYI